MEPVFAFANMRADATMSSSESQQTSAARAGVYSCTRSFSSANP